MAKRQNDLDKCVEDILGLISDENVKVQYVVDQNCKSNVYATFTDPRLRNAVTGDLIKLFGLSYMF